VNNGHRDFVFASRTQALKLRCLLRLYISHASVFQKAIVSGDLFALLPTTIALIGEGKEHALLRSRKGDEKIALFLRGISVRVVKDVVLQAQNNDGVKLKPLALGDRHDRDAVQAEKVIERRCPARRPIRQRGCCRLSVDCGLLIGRSAPLWPTKPNFTPLYSSQAGRF
jgi:hypothetical protein